MEDKMKEEELFIPKTKHKALKIILAILLIGGLIAGGYYLYKEKFDNPNVIVQNIVDAEIKKAEKSIKDTNMYKFNGVLKVNANLSDKYKPITDIINKLDLQFVLETDVKNKVFNGTINTKYKNEQVININTFIDDKNVYLLLNDVYDKYLKIASDNVTDIVTAANIDISEQDIKTILTSITKATRDTINDLEFMRTSTAIKVDDKDRNVYNNYTELKEDDVKKLAKKIVNSLANDSEFNKIFKKLAGDEASITDLNEVIEKATFPGTYRLNFYTDKSLFSPKLVSIRLEVINDDDKTSINYDKISDEEQLLLIDTSGGTITHRVKKTNSVYNINTSVNVLGMKVKLDLSSNYEKIKEVTKPDLSNSKEVEKLTEKEQEEIFKKLQENKGTTSLIEDISKINGLQEDL